MTTPETPDDLRAWADGTEASARQYDDLIISTRLETAAAIERALAETRERLAEVERERDAWKDSALQFHRNEGFYLGVLWQIGALFGDDAKRSDDGSMQDSVLVLKLPELVRAALSPVADPREAVVADPVVVLAQLYDAIEDSLLYVATDALQRAMDAAEGILNRHSDAAGEG